MGVIDGLIDGAVRLRWLALLLLTCCLAAGCADHGGHPVEQLTIYSIGSWSSDPIGRGPGPPPPGFGELSLSINRLIPAAFARGAVYAHGQVTWDGRTWPMTLELGADGSPYCRYAPGHPFTGSADPHGFRFRMLLADPPFEDMRSVDELFVDHRAAGQGQSLEQMWFAYERSDS